MAERLLELTLEGTLLPDETKVLFDGITTALNIKEFVELEERIAKLEEHAQVT